MWIRYHFYNQSWHFWVQIHLFQKICGKSSSLSKKPQVGQNIRKYDIYKLFQYIYIYESICVCIYREREREKERERSNAVCNTSDVNDVVILMTQFFSLCTHRHTQTHDQLYKCRCSKTHTDTCLCVHKHAYEHLCVHM